ncbi:hypothetical protein STCU_05782 [Strigomonas culicis]|nr:hypothetical protein STCU_05782 [Strigomonas culicis]|eukprot:EPY27376.1 hypothetical protein STCU_05782 [Strigomonas culicis]
MLDVWLSIRSIVAQEDTSLKTAVGIKKFCRELQLAMKEKRTKVIIFFSFVYITLQTFCIPGTVVLNAAIGALIGSLGGVLLCTLLGTVGACSCYILSFLVGTSLVEMVDEKLMKGKGLHTIRRQVRSYRSELFVYLLFLRLTPILPNWLVNMASPVAGVPLRVFALATAVGIVPQTYLSVRFGALAQKRDKSTRIVSVWDTLLLAVIACALIFALKVKKHFTTSNTAIGVASRAQEAGKTEVDILPGV